MIKAEDVGVQVGLEVLGADGMVNTVNTPLDVAPETLKTVDVGVAINILLGSMSDRLMGITQSGEPVVAAQLICVDCGTW